MRRAPTWEGDGEAGSALRGVSVHYLNTAFVEDLEAAGFSRESTIHDIEERVIRGKCAGVTCPRDGRAGSAFVDAIEGVDHAGRANFMLSYTWGYTVAMIADSLAEYCSKNGLDPKRTYVWICALCINQHRVQESRAKGETVPFQVFSQEFSSRVKGIGHVLALMGPWQDPMYIQRCWCIFELSIAMHIRCKCELIMPPSEMDSFVGQLLKDGSGITAVWNLLHRVCIKKAKASVPDDYNNIMRFIDGGCGLEVFNQQVRTQLETWFVDTAEEKVRALLISGSCCSVAGTVRVAGLLQEVGQHARALALLREGLQDLQDRPETRCLAAGIAAVTAAMGTAERLCSEPEASHASLLRALRMREEQGTLETAAGAELLASLGATQAVRGDPAGALESLRRARKVREAEGTLMDTPEGAGLLYEISLGEASLGRMDSAVESYETAGRAHKAAGLALMPSGLNIPLFSPGMDTCAMYSKSRQCFRTSARVCQGYREMGVLGTAYGAFTLTVLAYLQASLGELEAAAESCREASGICGSLELPPTFFGADLEKTRGFVERQLKDTYGQSQCAAEGAGAGVEPTPMNKNGSAQEKLQRVGASLQAGCRDWDLPFCRGGAARHVESACAAHGAPYGGA